MPLIVGGDTTTSGSLVGTLQQRIVVLGGKTLTGVDSNGVAWFVNGIDGWLNSPPVRTAATDRAADHGQWLPTELYGGKPYTINGTITAPSRALLQAAVDDLAAACNALDTLVTLQVTDGGITRQTDVRRNNQVLVKAKGPAGVTYSIPLSAPDPRVYDAALSSIPVPLGSVTGGFGFPFAFPLAFGHTSGGLATLTNIGNFEARPTIRFNGLLVAPWIENSTQGRRLTVADTIAAGDRIDVDTDARTVLAGGTASRAYVTSGAFPTLPPGDSEWRFGAASGTGNAVITYRSAWSN